MRIFKRKNLPVLILAGVLLLSLVGFILSSVRTSLASESNFVLSQTDYNSEYVVGDRVTVTDETISFENDDYPTVKSVIMPDGTSKTCDSFVITKTGKHQIVYKAKIANKLVTKRLSFIAKSELYSVNDKKSSATYGTNSYLPNTVKGINLSMVTGDTFSFNKVVDLSKLSAQDDIIKFYITPQNAGVPEFSEMVVTLTDIYDTSNQVKFYFSCGMLQPSVTWKYLYTTACATGQERTGFLYSYSYVDKGENNPSMKQIDGSWFNIYGGLPSAVSYTGEVEKGENYIQQYGKSQVDFIDNFQFVRLDYVEKKAYVQYGWSKFNLLTDLDDASVVGENVWKGFTTGEAVVDITFNGLVASSANVFIADIAGADLTEFNFVDQTPPYITVDFGEFEEGNLPNAYLNQAYPLFNASAIDSIDKELEHDVKVYYNYYGSAKSLVNVVDGKFTPTRAGEYTLVYSAIDSMGNKGIKCVDITCLNQENDFKVKISQDRDETVKVTSTVKVADFEIENATGASKVTITATLKSNPSVNYLLDNQELTFRPLDLGEFVIKYTATDFFKTVSDEYVITVEKENRPIFVNEPVVPRYLVKNSTYTFDTLTAYDYSTGSLKEINAELWLAKDSSGEEKLTPNVYTVDAESVVTLTYKATTADGSDAKTYNLPVIDTAYGIQGKVDSAKFFNGVGFTSNAETGKTQDYVIFEKAYDGQTAKLSYINDVLLSQCSINFAFIDELNNFESLSVVLTDPTNISVKTAVSFAKVDSTLTIKVNGKGNFVLDNVTNFVTFNYDYSTDTLKINGDALTINMSGYGVTPKSFGTPLAWLDFELNGIAENQKAGFGICTVMEQYFSNFKFDVARPLVYETGATSRLFAKGDLATFYPIYVVDAIDPNPTSSFSVKFNDEYVTSVDGILLKDVTDLEREYVIELTSYGEYFIEYYFADCYDQKFDNSYSITVKDMAAPVVTVPDSAKKVYNRGDTVSVAKPKIFDDSQTTTTVMVYTPEGVVENVKKNKFNANKAGLYTIYYYVLDTNNNLTIASYQITVV
ncbi:MAG: hypothetical protein IJV99_03230 [Clostridia bacterium]|nr:hypothetical protein [Clostridia bacterium]